MKNSREFIAGEVDFSPLEFLRIINEIFILFMPLEYSSEVRSWEMRFEFVFSRRQEIYDFLETNVHILFC